VPLQEEDEDEDQGPQFEGFDPTQASGGFGGEEEDKAGMSIEEVPEDEAEKLTEAAGAAKDEL